MTSRTDNPVQRVLVVEDEPDIADLLELHLLDLGAEVVKSADGDAALALAQAEPWDLIMLDIRLPGTDGLEICRKLRAQSITVPILLLTAKSAELDRVLGLEVGADDYVTKPFSVLEVMARVRAIFRRVALEAQTPGISDAGNRYCYGALQIDVDQREVQVGERRLELTAKEFDLLAFFAAHPGKVFRRAQLLDQVWGYGHEGYEHTVNSHINRLRAKVQPLQSSPRYIVTVWGVGYKFEAQPQAEAVIDVS
ncbi:MAG: response regulator transcription factor [Pseudomonadales bacterium]